MSGWQTRVWLLSPRVSSLPGRVSSLVISGSWLKTPSQDLTFRKDRGPNALKIRSDKDNSYQISHITSSSWKLKSQSFGYTFYLIVPVASLNTFTWDKALALKLTQTPWETYREPLRMNQMKERTIVSSKTSGCLESVPLLFRIYLFILFKMKVIFFWFVGGVAEARNWSLPFIVTQDLKE